MEKLKLALFTAIVVAVMAFLHFRGGGTSRSEHEASLRIRTGVQAAEDKLPRPPATMGLDVVERYAADLRGVDSTGAPEALRAALSNYAAAVEQHRDRIRSTGAWDTNTAWQVGEAQGEFRRALTGR